MSFLPESGEAKDLTWLGIASTTIVHKFASSSHYPVRNKHFCDTAIAAFRCQGIFIAQLTSAWFATITFTLLFLSFLFLCRRFSPLIDTIPILHRFISLLNFFYLL